MTLTSYKTKLYQRIQVYHCYNSNVWWSRACKFHHRLVISKYVKVWLPGKSSTWPTYYDLDLKYTGVHVIVKVTKKFHVSTRNFSVKYTQILVYKTLTLLRKVWLQDRLMGDTGQCNPYVPLFRRQFIDQNEKRNICFIVALYMLQFMMMTQMYRQLKICRHTVGHPCHLQVGFFYRSRQAQQ